jgi:hypothetical protein
VLKLPGKTKAAVGKLNQVGLDVLPESNVVVYRFADTPIDMASAESGNYELLVIAKTKSGPRPAPPCRSRSTGDPRSGWTPRWPTSRYRVSAPIDVTIGDDFFGRSATCR